MKKFHKLKRKAGKTMWTTTVKTKIKHRYLMATSAFHNLGDISNEIPDLCEVSEEDEENYYGMWVLGFGFINVRFPKSTTRKLNKVEFEKWSKAKLRLSGMTYNLSEESLKLGTDFES